MPYTVYTVFTIQTALCFTVAFMPLYIVREGENANGTAVWGGDSGQKLFGEAH